MDSEQSPKWLEKLVIPIGSDTLLEVMKQRKIPLTRENYIKLAFPDIGNAELSAEEEMDLPEQFRRGD